MEEKGDESLNYRDGTCFVEIRRKGVRIVGVLSVFVRHGRDRGPGRKGTRQSE